MDSNKVGRFWYTV